MTAETLVTVTAPHFVAGAIILDSQVVRAAPIIKYMVGWKVGKLISYVESKGWIWDVSGLDEE